MSREYIPSTATLHQQDGGMSVQAFAAKEGITESYLRRLIKRGLVLGASKHPLSKKWCIYPPAKIADGSCTIRPTIRRREKSAAQSPNLLARGSADTGEAGTDSRQLGQPVPQVEAEGKRPPASPVLTLKAAALPVAARTQEHGIPASCGKRPMVYTSPEVQSVRRILHEAAARQYRQGIHYLRLEGRELSQLYAALDHERSRIRKLIGKGLVDVGNLRASDSVWQKMQAMCQQGRLL